MTAGTPGSHVIRGEAAVNGGRASKGGDAALRSGGEPEVSIEVTGPEIGRSAGI